MKTKVVYVLVASENNYYLEQTVISAYSLKLHTPNVNICLLVDKDTKNYIERIDSVVKKYVNDIIVVDTPEDFKPVEKSRFIKTNIRSLISGDLLYIDTDTVICEDISDIDTIQDEIAMVPDYHVAFKDIPIRNQVLLIGKKYFNEDYSDAPYYFNGGAIYSKDTHKSYTFFERWHEYWLENLKKNDVVKDQPPLLKVCKSFDYEIGHLPDIYNFQVSFNINLLATAKIMHFFNVMHRNAMHGNAIHPMLTDFPYKEIRSQNKVAKEIRDLILNVKRAYVSPLNFMTEKDFALHTSQEVETFICCLHSRFAIAAKIFIRIINILYSIKCTFIKIFNH